MTLTRDLGQFVSDLAPNRVPEEAARIARIGFIDCIGVMFAGREEEPTRLLRDVLRPPAGPASGTPRQRPRQPRSTAWPPTRSTTTTWRCAATRARSWSPPSWPRPRRWTCPGATWWPPTSPATRSGRSWRGARADTTTARAGTPPASSAPSRRQRPAPPCGGWTRRAPPRRLRWGPRRARA